MFVSDHADDLLWLHIMIWVYLFAQNLNLKILKGQV